MALPFELRSLPDAKKRRVYLCQLPYKTSAGVPQVDEPKTVAKADGTQLEAIRSILTDVVGQSTPLDEFLEEGGQIAIEESEAIRLSLAFVAIEGLRSDKRMGEMITGIRGWDDKKVATWFQEVSDDTTGNVKAALRVMLTGEI